MKIYLARNNVQAGPYTLEELNTMLASGEVVLDDLAWHSGMSAWQRLGDLTHNRYIYQPNAQPTDTNNAPQSNAYQPNGTTSKPQRGFGDNVDFYPAGDTQRATLDKLYGREPSTQPTSPITNTEPQGLVYASIGSRVLAFAINTGLYLLALLPAMLALLQIIDMQKLSSFSDYASMQAYAQTLANQVNPTTIATSNIMLFALFAIQLLLIMMRGQSFGKMVMGIRVLDPKSQKLPSLGTLVVMRTVLLVAIYFMALSFFSGVPAIALLVVNYVLANNHPQKQGWHDKITKTIVAKAHPTQLDKIKQ